VPLPRSGSTINGAAKVEEKACFRIFNAEDRFIANCADPLRAAVMVSTLGHGAT